MDEKAKNNNKFKYKFDEKLIKYKGINDHKVKDIINVTTGAKINKSFSILNGYKFSLKINLIPS